MRPTLTYQATRVMRFSGWLANCLIPARSCQTTICVRDRLWFRDILAHSGLEGEDPGLHRLFGWDVGLSASACGMASRT